ncbi:cupin domain-containing protein [Burkholderia ambifaria]|uniref:cupin domain-containing protein n=1 Tax=Burkholderia ambifaria TaxID=152480 RepID=UPI00315C831B
MNHHESLRHIDFGVDKATFLNFYYEKNILHRKGAFNADIVPLSEVDSVLEHSDWNTNGFKLHDGREIALGSFTEDYDHLGLRRRRVDKKRFYELMRGGVSLVANSIDEHSRIVRSLCDEIAAFVEMPVVANGYLTFGDKNPFGNHWDTHDVFAVQLLGRKRWQLFKPTFPLPLVNQKSKFCKAECPKDPVLDVILEAGDFIYIPRGWWHNAQGLNERTFHLAVGIHPPRMIDYVKWIAEQLLPSKLEARRGARCADEASGAVDELTAALSALVSDKENFRAFTMDWASKERFKSSFDLSRYIEGGSESIECHHRIALNTVSHVELSDKTIVVNGKVNTISRIERDVIQMLNERGSMSVTELYEALELSPDDCREAVWALGVADVARILHDA